MPEETIDAIKRFHKRREARLRQQLNEAGDLMKKYRILKAIYRNRRFERHLLQKYLDIGGKSSTIKLPVQLDGEFNEEDHPRDENGQFTSGESSSGTSKIPDVPATDKSKTDKKPPQSERIQESTKTANAAENQGESKTAKEDKTVEAEKGTVAHPSAQGINISCKGFSSPKALTRHLVKHGRQLGFSSEAEYQEAADSFLQKPCSGSIVGYCTPKGKVVRFDTATTEYASGFPGQNICTYMKAKCKKDGSPDIEKAKTYYEKFKEKDGC